MSKKKKSHKKNKRPRFKPSDKKSLLAKTIAPTVIAQAVIAQPVIAQAVIAQPVIAQAVIAPPKKSPTKINSSRPKSIGARIENYLMLMRVDKPIGILLLLWPTYWALWLAAGGFPSAKNLFIFAWGCILMRSAGCVMNDYADRHFDGKVKRTKDRMIVAGKVSPNEALILFFVLCALAFVLVLFTNRLTVLLSIGGLLLAACYPFAKRFTHLPQVVLGMAFAWSVPMAWTAQHNAETLSAVIDHKVWLVYLAVIIWALIYDTFYAMVDREDDIKIGIKSTAILFGDADKSITAILQALMIFTLILIGRKFELGAFYYAGLVMAAGLFAYQQYLIKDRKPEKCFQAFLNNNYVGLVVFAGIVTDFYF